MQVRALAAAALALALLSSAPAPAEGARGRVPARRPGARSTSAEPPPAGEEGDVSGQGSARGHPAGGEGRAAAPAGLLLGSARHDKAPKHQPSRNRGLGHHLKGYGKFNSDTHSCHGIQSRPCQKPSDCDGCLGLYTCKPPKGTCDLKAVSRE